jgi:hypothetical protein
MLEELLRRASLTLETAASLLRRLSTNPWLSGTEVTAVVPAGSAFVSVPHGLGRAMNGAAIVGSTDASLRASVDLSSSTTIVTVRLSAAAGSDFSVKLRVY